MTVLKKFLVLSFLIAALEGASQNTDDVVWIPRKDAVGTLARVERLKADSAQLVQCKWETIDLKNRVTGLEQSNKDFAAHIETLDLRINNYIMQVSEAERALKKQRRRTALATVGGIALSASFLFMLISK